MTWKCFHKIHLKIANQVLDLSSEQNQNKVYQHRAIRQFQVIKETLATKLFMVLLKGLLLSVVALGSNRFIINLHLTQSQRHLRDFPVTPPLKHNAQLQFQDVLKMTAVLTDQRLIWLVSKRTLGFKKLPERQ